MSPPIVAGGSGEKDRSASSYPGRVLFPGNVVPHRNVAWEEVNCGSVTRPSAHPDSGDPNRVTLSNCGDEAHLLSRFRPKYVDLVA